MRKIVVIKGPTSSGKTSLAIKLCQKFNGVIISADSRQVYKQMDIGTGKIPIQANNFIKNKSINGEVIFKANDIDIYGYDLINPDNSFSAHDFERYFVKKISQIQSNKLIFLVGGTGFFIDVALGKKQVALVEPNPDLRKRLESKTIAELVDLLKKLNPDKYNTVDKNNRSRLIRAIEINTNNNILKTQTGVRREEIDTLQIGLTTKREVLYKNADTWLDTIWKKGLIDETKSLMESFSGSDKLRGLVYKSVCAFINGDSSEINAQTQAKLDLHHYIKRQLTWFRKDNEINWFDIQDPNFESQIETKIQEFLMV